MAQVIFYENPRSSSCHAQKERLVALGHDVDARDVTREAWSVSSLRPYFGAKPVRDWFDPAAAKAHDIDVENVTPQAAKPADDAVARLQQLKQMLDDCCLIELDQRGGVIAYEARDTGCDPCRRPETSTPQSCR